MTIQMNLQPRYFEYVATGTKRIELRLFDEKRQQIKLGDEIIFACGDEQVRTCVVGLLRYATFEDLFTDFPVEILADEDMTKAELLTDLSEFYPLEKQQKLGVLGIRFRLIA